MKKYAVIVAGGSGQRMGGELPKQFQDLKGVPMLCRSMKAFHEEDEETEIILVLPENYISLWRELFSSLCRDYSISHKIAKGGSSRTESVKNGLALIPDKEESLVAVHDAARPLITKRMIEAGWKEAEEKGAAVPAVPVIDSLRLINSSGKSEAVDRSLFVAVQTPQVFKTSLLKRAYKENPEKIYSDDATAVEAIGQKISLFEGEVRNMKVTNPGDFEIAALYIQ